MRKNPFQGEDYDEELAPVPRQPDYDNPFAPGPPNTQAPYYPVPFPNSREESERGVYPDRRFRFYDEDTEFPQRGNPGLREKRDNPKFHRISKGDTPNDDDAITPEDEAAINHLLDEFMWENGRKQKGAPDINKMRQLREQQKQLYHDQWLQGWRPPPSYYSIGREPEESESTSSTPGFIERMWKEFMEFRNNRPAAKKREEEIKQWHLQQGKKSADRENMGSDLVERGPPGQAMPRPRPSLGPEWHNQFPAKKYRDDPNEDEGY